MLLIFRYFHSTERRAMLGETLFKLQVSSNLKPEQPGVYETGFLDDTAPSQTLTAQRKPQALNFLDKLLVLDETASFVSQRMTPQSAAHDELAKEECSSLM